MAEMREPPAGDRQPSGRHEAAGTPASYPTPTPPATLEQPAADVAREHGLARKHAGTALAHDLRPSRLAAELRDLLAEFDDLCDALGDIALEAMFAAEDVSKATPAGKALSAMFFRIDDQRGPLDRATAQLRAIIVRLDSAERMEGGHG